MLIIYKNKLIVLFINIKECLKKFNGDDIMELCVTGCIGGKVLKRIFLLIIIINSLFIMSCGNEKEQTPNLSENKIYPKELTTSEKDLLSLIGFNDTIDIYDFETDGSFNSISIWLEVYKNGELLENRGKMVSSFDSEKGSIAVKVNKNKSYDWRISIKSDGKISSMAFESVDDFLKDKSYSIASSHMETTAIENEKPIILKMFLFDSDGSISVYGFQHYEENPELLKEYDYVYLLKGEFSENNSANHKMEDLEED